MVVYVNGGFAVIESAFMNLNHAAYLHARAISCLSFSSAQYSDDIQHFKCTQAGSVSHFDQTQF